MESELSPGSKTVYRVPHKVIKRAVPTITILNTVSVGAGYGVTPDGTTYQVIANGGTNAWSWAIVYSADAEL